MLDLDEEEGEPEAKPARRHRAGPPLVQLVRPRRYCPFCGIEQPLARPERCPYCNRVLN